MSFNQEQSYDADMQPASVSPSSSVSSSPSMTKLTSLSANNSPSAKPPVHPRVLAIKKEYAELNFEFVPPMSFVTVSNQSGSVVKKYKTPNGL